MQYDFGTIDPATKSGGALAADLEQWRDALHTLHRGASAPPYAEPGMLWLKEVSSSLWELNVYTALGDIKLGAFNPDAGTWSLTAAGATLIGDLLVQKASPQMILDASAAGQARSFIGRTNGSIRWGLELGDATAESGSNAGSNMRLVSYDDSGVILGVPLEIARSTGIATFSVPPRVGVDPSNNDDLARKIYVDTKDHWVKISDTAITAVTEIDFTWTAGAYNKIRATIIGAEPNPAAVVNMAVRLRRAATWITTSVYVDYGLYVLNGAVTGFNSTQASGFFTAGALHVATAAPVAGELTLHLNGSGQPHYFDAISHSVGDSAGVATTLLTMRSCRLPSAVGEEVTGIRFYWTGGNTFLAQGRIILEGLKP